MTLFSIYDKAFYKNSKKPYDRYFAGFLSTSVDIRPLFYLLLILITFNTIIKAIELNAIHATLRKILNNRVIYQEQKGYLYLKTEVVKELVFKFVENTPPECLLSV